MNDKTLKITAKDSKGTGKRMEWECSPEEASKLVTLLSREGFTKIEVKKIIADEGTTCTIVY